MSKLREGKVGKRKERGGKPCISRHTPSMHCDEIVLPIDKVLLSHSSLDVPRILKNGDS